MHPAKRRYVIICLLASMNGVILYFPFFQTTSQGGWSALSTQQRQQLREALSTDAKMFGKKKLFHTAAFIEPDVIKNLDMSDAIAETVIQKFKEHELSREGLSLNHKTYLEKKLYWNREYEDIMFGLRQARSIAVSRMKDALNQGECIVPSLYL